MDKGYEIITDKAFLRPDLDDNSYRAIRLPNQLVAILVQDASCDKAGVSLDVKIGSVHDPNNMKGLAHFCEHLLFMGTEKFPKENEYNDFLNAHSGQSNAYTAKFNTNYHFSVDPKELNGGLDRFSQFFISPLFLKDCQDREIKAIESEHTKNIDNDDWIFGSILKNSANPNHPCTKFTTGNEKTLIEEPKKSGLEPRTELIKWYNTFYSSNIMKLSVVSNQSLDELSNLVVKHFSTIRNKNVDLLKLNENCSKIPYYTPKELQKNVKYKPINKKKALIVGFKLNMTEIEYRSLNLNVINHLIGHESEGSLFYELRNKKNWVYSLGASIVKISEDNYVTFILLNLNDEGYLNKNEVLKLTIEYLNFVKNLKFKVFQEIFNELKEISKLSFKFSSKNRNTLSVAIQNAGLINNRFINDENIHLFLGINQMFSQKFDEKILIKNLDDLNINNLIILEKNHEFENLKIKDPWYNTTYSVDSINQELLSNFEKILNDKNYSNSKFKLPPLPNPFIPKNFQIYNKSSDKKRNRPLLIEKTLKREIWLKKDDRFNLPRGKIIDHLILPFCEKNPISIIFSKILVQMLNSKLNSVLYLAEDVNMDIAIFNSYKGISFTFKGYNDKILSIVKFCYENFMDLLIDDEEFNNPIKFNFYKEDIIKNYLNFKFKTPFKAIDIYNNCLILNNKFSPEDNLQYLIDPKTEESIDDFINYESFKHFQKLILKQMYIMNIIVGNFDDSVIKEYKKIVDKILYANDILKPSPVIQSQTINDCDRVLKLSKGINYLYYKTIDNSNSCTKYYFEFEDLFKIDKDFRNNDLSTLKNDLSPGIVYLALEMFGKLFRNHFFDQLRTKEQLGYVVLCYLTSNRSIYSLNFMIQSGVKSCDYLTKRINDYIKNELKDYLYNLSDEDFNKTIKSIQINYEDSLNFKNLEQEVSNYDYNIFTQSYRFDSTILKLKNLKFINKAQLIKVFDQYILNDLTSKRLIINLKGLLEKNYEKNYENFPKINGELIDNIGLFKSKLDLSSSSYPPYDLDYYKSYENESLGKL